MRASLTGRPGPPPLGSLDRGAGAVGADILGLMCPDCLRQDNGLRGGGHQDATPPVFQGRWALWGSGQSVEVPGPGLTYCGTGCAFGGAGTRSGVRPKGGGVRKAPVACASKMIRESR